MTAKDGIRRVDDISLEVRAGEITGMPASKEMADRVIEALARSGRSGRISDKLNSMAAILPSLNARKTQRTGHPHVTGKIGTGAVSCSSPILRKLRPGIHYRKPAVTHDDSASAFSVGLCACSIPLATEPGYHSPPDTALRSSL